MPKMIALKRFHYPSGVHGKTYEAGDEVDVKTDRDAKALRILKVAKDPPTPEDKPRPPAYRRDAEEAAAHKDQTAEESSAPKRRPYRRSDMTPEGGNE